MTQISHDLGTRASVEKLLFHLASGPEKEIEIKVADTEMLDRLIPGFDALRSCGQGSARHCEGDARVHTGKVFANVARLSEGIVDEDRYILLVAALLHDIEKPSTRQENEGKVTFYNHAEKAAERTAELAEKFHLSNAETDQLAFLIRNHMTAHLLPGQGEKKRLELYESPHFSMLTILQEADALASWESPDGTKHGEVLRAFFKTDREQVLEKQAAAALAERLFTDMTAALKDLGVQPGPYFGQVKKALGAAIRSGEVVTSADVASYVTNYHSENPPS